MNKLVIHTLAFEDLYEVFSSKRFWDSNYVIFWYKKAWSRLIKHGLADYKNNIELNIVYLRALSLIMIYAEYCQLVFDLYCGYDSYEDTFIDIVSEFIIGQLYYEQENRITNDFNYAICVLADIERDKVVNTLMKDSEFGSYWFIVGAYFSVVVPYVKNDKDLKSNDPMTFEEYCKYIEDYPDEELMKSSELMDAWTWLLDGTYAVESFYESGE